MIGLALGTFAVLGGVAALAYVSEDTAAKFMAKHEKVADFFGWEVDVDEKKAPAVAAAGAKNFSNKIYNLSVAREAKMRKAAK